MLPKLCKYRQKLLPVPFLLAMVSFVLYRVSLDRIGWWPCVFFVPFLWYYLCRIPTNPKEELFPTNDSSESNVSTSNNHDGDHSHKRPGKVRRFFSSFYVQLWLAAAIFWGNITFWLTYPHPATVLGWFALACYLACYFPLLIGLSRYCAQGSRLRLFPAMLLAWLLVEWLRKWMLGGFSFASLEHAFYRYPLWIQIADIVSEYGVGLFIFLVGIIAAWGCERIHSDTSSRYKQIGRITIATIMILLLITSVLTYGHFRIRDWQRLEANAAKNTEPLRIALLQENTTFRFPVPNETNSAIHYRYMAMSNEASKSNPHPDLIVWPESSFASAWYEVTPDGLFPGMEKMSPNERSQEIIRILERQNSPMIQWQTSLGCPVLLGIPVVCYDRKGDAACYNSALWIDGQAKPLRYDKTSLVMFGEYLPFAQYLPDSFPLKTLCQSVTPGSEPVVFPLQAHGQSARILVNICFESSIARLIRHQIQWLKERNQEPDILINMSNDGWFQYSSQIEFHLATQVFRAVENRKTVLSSTHAGYAAWIDPSGTIRRQGQRRKNEAVFAEVILPRQK